MLGSSIALAQGGNDGIEQRLSMKFPVSVVNAEGGFVKQGALLTLKKSGMHAAIARGCGNEYKDGKLGLVGFSRVQCSPANYMQNGVRKFVMGESFYLTGIQIKDTVYLSLLSEPKNDMNYKADLKLYIGKGASITYEQAEQMISQIFTIGAAQAPQQAPVAESRPARRDDDGPRIAPPPPPPPPPAETPKVQLGMTPEQVVGILGQPTTMADAGPAKKFYTYPRMKIVFVDGKVADFQ